MDRGISFLFFVGGFNGSEVERLVGRAHHAITLDTIEAVLECDFTRDVIVSTDSPELAAALASWPVMVEFDAAEFHFGRCLRDLIHKHRIDIAFCAGGGSTGLLTRRELESFCRHLLELDNVQVANNFWSCDFVGFNPASAIDRIELPAIDNNLAFLLERQAGLTTVPVERSVGTMFDVDTPSDVMVLRVHPAAGPRSRAYVDSLDLDVSHIRRAMACFTQMDSEIVVAGRVGSHVLAHLETETACRTRFFAEERGMRASGREDRGEVRSLLGYHYQAVGAQRFFETIGQLGRAVFLDSRVIFNHLGLSLPAPDRFYSDLRRPDCMANQLAREFTEAAMHAPVPVVLGGHSIVAGGLWALIDAAWQEHDARAAMQDHCAATSGTLDTI